MTRPRRHRPDEPDDELVHPADLAAWRARQDARRRVRGWLARTRDRVPPTGVLTGGPDARVLVALDADTPSNRAALLEPLRFLDPDTVAVFAPGPVPGTAVRGATRTAATVDELARSVPRVHTVVSAGGYLPISGLAHRFIERVDGRTFVVQHGALTPFSPPLPPATTLLAWSAPDAAFWTRTRDDVATRVVGSQLAWSATIDPAPPVDPTAPPVFLGQLHGTELPRVDVLRISRDFCRATGAIYRPHPSERDKVSRLGHLVLRTAGVGFAPTDVPVDRVDAPVVGIFSSGIIEAAAAGLPTWGHHPDPPRWILGFWERYGIAPWGGDPTPPPPRPDTEPAEAVARIVGTPIGDP